MVNQFNRSGLMLGALLCCMLPSFCIAQQSTGPLPLETLRQLSDVYGLIKSDYVEAVDDKKLLTEAINGMLSSIDPSAVYLDRTAFKAMRAAAAGNALGKSGAELGLEVVMQEGYLKVVAPLDDSAFASAGVQAGDVIVRIDGVSLLGLSLNQALQKLRGSGRQHRIVLSLARKGLPVTAVVTARTLQVPGVKAKMIAPGYAWVRIARFQEATAGDMLNHVRQLYGAHMPMKGIVLDLRNAAGGALRGALDVSALFLPKEALITSTRGQLPQSNQLFYGQSALPLPLKAAESLASANLALKNVPLVVLVNTGSATSAEIVAGALQDYQRATIVGTATFGKASVQSVHQLGSDTAVRLTTALYYTPHGHVIEAHGIVPDLQVDDRPNTLALAASRPLQSRPVYGSAADFQLTQALNHLKGLPVTLATLALLNTEAQSDAAPAADK